MSLLQLKNGMNDLNYESVQAGLLIIVYHQPTLLKVLSLNLNKVF